MTKSKFSPCILIPCYNHGSTMAHILLQLEAYDLPCVIVDDGSNLTTSKILLDLTEHYEWVNLVVHSDNQGKGAAVLSGIKYAYEQGYSHGLQLDADGQHQLSDIPLLLEKSENSPEKVISGQPIYDDSIPKARYYGRYFTHAWVWIETLSFSIKDSMCGFRVYPLEAVTALAAKKNLGLRMDFDIEIMVRLYWQGVQIEFIQTKVIYPKDGISHFDAVLDNMRITWMHTRLFFLMLPQIPKLLLRNLGKNTKLSEDNLELHWSKTQEKKGLWGIRFMLKSYQILGRGFFNILLYPVIAYFWLSSKQARKSSHDYLLQLQVYGNEYSPKMMLDMPKNINSFKHLMRFGEAMLDKLASWRGDIRLNNIYISNQEDLHAQVNSGKGTLLIGSHLGDFEVCRALGQLSYDIKINALVFTKHAQRFNQVMAEINPKSSINLIQVDNLGADTAILLKQKIDAGEWVAIVGDRTPLREEAPLREEIPLHIESQFTTNQVNTLSKKESVIWSDFFGKAAPFPKGPFILASILKCPVFLMFCLKPKGSFEIYFEKFADPLILTRAQRQHDLQKIVDNYAKRLQYYCLKSPLDWFNFYDFWQLSKHNQAVKQILNKDKK